MPRAFATACRLAVALALCCGLSISTLAETPSPAPPPAAGAPAAAPAAKASAARLAGDAQRSRLVIDLSAPIDFQAFILADPYRVVIDLPQIDFAMPAETGRKGRGLVSAYRFGLIAPGKSRIVLDLANPATIDSATLIKPVDDQPARLVVEVTRTDRAAFLHAVAAQQRPAPAEQTGSTPPQPPGGATPQPSALPVVVLDPGHGGIDTGAVTPTGEEEKAIVLDFAKMLAAKLTAGGHYRAVLTRQDDTFVTLPGRIDIARHEGAALFVSIHADTLPDPFGVRGATIYTLSDRASDAEAARYAEKENRADAIAGVDLSAEPDDVADILIDLTRRETKSFSNQFAKVLIGQFKQAAALNKNPHRSAGFRVLKAPDVPSVLLELGYLSNKQDAKLLLSDDWRGKATDAVMAAVDAFFADRQRDIRATSN